MITWIKAYDCMYSSMYESLIRSRHANIEQYNHKVVKSFLSIYVRKIILKT